MSQYFDKDFFKFLLGFVAIIIVSCLVILLTRIYQDQKTIKTTPAMRLSVRRILGFNDFFIFKAMYDFSTSVVRTVKRVPEKNAIK